jgi:hypothetical protein
MNQEPISRRKRSNTKPGYDSERLRALKRSPERRLTIDSGGWFPLASVHFEMNTQPFGLLPKRPVLSP